MKTRRDVLRGSAALAATYALPAGLIGIARAQAQDEIARPLDVPYVPTPVPVVDAMLDLAKVNKSDVVYDLGCGDGRIVVRAASRFGCRGVGVDLNPERVKEAKANAARAGVTELTRFEVGDVFEFDFSGATVVTMYLLPSVNLKLRPRLLKELKPGTRLVSPPASHLTLTMAPSTAVTTPDRGFPRDATAIRSPTFAISLLNCRCGRPSKRERVGAEPTGVAVLAARSSLRAPHLGASGRAKPAHPGRRKASSMSIIEHPVTRYGIRSPGADAIAAENARLRDELDSSRARIIQAADAERRRLERDLHDGAQQRLVALSLELKMIALELAPDSEAECRLAAARTELQSSLEAFWSGSLATLKEEVEAEEGRRSGRGHVHRQH